MDYLISEFSHPRTDGLPFTTKIDYIMNIFKTISTELPEQMLYREDGDTMELKTLDSIGDCFPLELQNNGWNLISSQAAGA